MDQKKKHKSAAIGCFTLNRGRGSSESNLFPRSRVEQQSKEYKKEEREKA